MKHFYTPIFFLILCTLLGRTHLDIFAAEPGANSSLSDKRNSVEIDGVTFSFSGPATWITGTDPELNGATVYSAPSPESEQNRSIMTGEIVGPAFIEYYAQQIVGSNYLGGLYVDDTDIHRYYSERSWEKYSHQLGAGAHKVEFVIDDFSFREVGLSPVKYADIKITYGYQLMINHSGGILSISPEKATYQNGDIISLSVTPLEDNRFVRWSGTVNSESASILHTVDDHMNLEAIFEATDLGFGNNLRISNGVRVFWQTDIVRNEDRALMAAANENTKRFWYEVDVSRSGIVRWDVVYETDVYSNHDRKTFLIDSILSEPFSRYYLSDFNKYSFWASVNPGRNTLRWQSENTFSRGPTAFPLILENIQFEESQDNSYEAWMSSWGLDPVVNGDPSDDPNEDRIPNILHYAFKTDPVSPNREVSTQRIAVTTIDGENYMTLTIPIHTDINFYQSEEGYARYSINGYEFRVNASTTLSNFSLGKVEVLEPPLSQDLPELPPDYAYRTFIATDPMKTGDATFMRTYVNQIR